MTQEHKSEMARVSEKANICLDLQRHIVGVKLLSNEEEFAKADARQLRSPLFYCVMVAQATLGRARKASLAESGCPSAARALGLTDPKESWLSGDMYTHLCMYENEDVSRKVVRNTSCIRHRSYGVMTKPLDHYDEAPDTVIVVTNPYNAMRILQGYTYKFGTNRDFKIIGNQAICSESTAYPYENDDINLSMMCTGTRYIARWADDEMAIGIPYSKFVTTIDGLFDTINVMERNEGKHWVEDHLTPEYQDTLDIKYDWNYFNDVETSENPGGK